MNIVIAIVIYLTIGFLIAANADLELEERTTLAHLWPLFLLIVLVKNVGKMTRSYWNE